MERVHRERPGATKGTYGNYLALTRTEGVHTYSQDFHGISYHDIKVSIMCMMKFINQTALRNVSRISKLGHI